MTTVFVLTDTEAGAVQAALISYVEDEASIGERRDGITAVEKVRRQRSVLTADEIERLAEQLAGALAALRTTQNQYEEMGDKALRAEREIERLAGAGND